ncbi:thymidylate kinase, partial [Leptospira interrogans serovar Pomona]|nr:thymidylate kinase [Leptospira interrogans serovar Pomona]
MKIEKPIFVVFEGIDGSGKSTLCKSLTEKLTERGI